MPPLGAFANGDWRERRTPSYWEKSVRIPYICAPLPHVHFIYNASRRLPFIEAIRDMWDRWRSIGVLGMVTMIRSQQSHGNRLGLHLL